MARSAKPGTGKPATPDKTTADPATTPLQSDDMPAGVSAESSVSADPVPTEVIEDAEIVAPGEPANDPADDTLKIEDPAPAADTPWMSRPSDPEPAVQSDPDHVEPTQDAPPPPSRPDPVMPPAPQVVVQKVGFVPIVLGGAIAAALGFGAAWYMQGQLQDPTLPVTIAAQGDRLDTLEGQVANLPAPPDLGPLTAEIAATRVAIDDATAPISATLATLDERVTALERAPAADGTLADAAIASWQAEIETLRAEIAAQEARMQGIADEAAERLSMAQSTVEEIEQSATESANMALQRAAVTRIQAALDTGSAFDDALGELSGLGAAVPDELAAVATDGVPTLAALQQSFPDVARAALSAARAEGLADDGDNAVMALLRSTLDVRSVAPREGDDPDAILSRAEAALRDGHLADTLAEVDTLPEVVRAEMAAWTQAATARLSALAAAEALSQSLNAN